MYYVRGVRSDLERSKHLGSTTTKNRKLRPDSNTIIHLDIFDAILGSLELIAFTQCILRAAFLS